MIGENEMKNAIITGATGGIGEAISRKLAEEGYHLALLYGHNHEKAKILESELSKITRVKMYPIDFKDHLHIQEKMEVILQDFTYFDCLIHGAGKSYRNIFHEMKDMDFEDLLDVNLKPLYYVTKAVLPGMLKREKGSIIGISSIWGANPAAMEVAYAMTKGAMEQYIKSLAAEVSYMKIAVNGIAPGGVDTAMLNNFSTEEKESFIQDIPFQRLAKPEEIADLVFYLLTKGTYITGQIITMDGGFTLN